MRDLFMPADSFESKKAKIKVIGVGGGGGNAINHMVASGLKDVDFIAVNTDAQDLRRNSAPYLVQVGEKITKGLGVGGDPEKGKRAAEESKEKLKQIIGQCDLLFITAGMGGGTGTGVAPYLAKLAKELYGDDLLVVGVVTRPFNFEGYVREKQADEGIQEMQKHVDSMIIVPNEKLFANIDPETSSKDAFQMVDEVLLQAVKGIAEVITQPGEVNIDFNDIRKVMAKSHKSLIGIGEASGPGRHLQAVKKAISSPLLENADIRGAKGFIVHFSAEDNLPLLEQGEVMNLIRQYASNDSIIMFGQTYDATLNGVFKVTVIATGFSAEKANVFNTRRVTAPESPMPSAPAMPAESILSFPEDSRLSDPASTMRIPAFLRRKQNRH
ncbi:MAG: cell division protein FtsZ [Elusimicrobium sp.]|uniref:Cell division protein FtsZ n=1 Tax=Candidatus Avelusimicrobium gallicola TaxID=2562704 RepID=A0A928DQ61_9BACT|nr:cell division protein FtsZ [Elusimicrobium sp.]